MSRIGHGRNLNSVASCPARKWARRPLRVPTGQPFSTPFAEVARSAYDARRSWPIRPWHCYITRALSCRGLGQTRGFRHTRREGPLACGPSSPPGPYRNTQRPPRKSPIWGMHEGPSPHYNTRREAGSASCIPPSQDKRPGFFRLRVSASPLVSRTLRSSVSKDCSGAASVHPSGPRGQDVSGRLCPRGRPFRSSATVLWPHRLARRLDEKSLS